MKNNEFSFAEKHPKLNMFLGLVLIVAIGAFLIWILKLLYNLIINGIIKLTDVASKLDAVIIVALITGVVSIIGVIISSVVTKIIDYRKSRQEYLTQKREKPYGEFVEMIYQVQKNAKDPGTYSDEQMLEDLSKFSKQITLWGSSRVINKWNEFRENGSDPKRAKDNLFLTEEIMNDMRKDLGLKKVKKGNLLGFFVNDIKSELKNSSLIFDNLYKIKFEFQVRGQLKSKNNFVISINIIFINFLSFCEIKQQCNKHKRLRAIRY